MENDELIKLIGPSGVTVIGLWVVTLYIKSVIREMLDKVLRTFAKRLDSLDARLSRVEQRL